ncbi:MAG: ABC transporter ATP-binding protein [Chthoniobacterales bacterium]|nr:ABC transporter ATP-binding protein [Chthoniobacterales bacterium]
MVSIKIDRLVKSFGSTPALCEINLEIKGGELFFLLGPSGCGKTTLLRCIAGFYIPDKGQILFGNEDVTKLPPHKRNTGMVFQSYALWPHMTVAQNVAFGLEERKIPRDEIRQRVYDALESVRMAQFSERKITQLSGGQQQRVALARALVIRPKCLLLDEPLSNLDAKLRLEMRTEIRKVCKDAGLTAIYVTHDQKEALSISDRMAILEGGKIAQIGTPNEIYRRPHTKTVADFIGETNFIKARFLQKDGEMWIAESEFGQLFAGYPGNPKWTPSPNESILLSIRPECWNLTDSISNSSSPPRNSLIGKVGESVYLGEVAQYRFVPNHPNGTSELKIFELNPRTVARPSSKDYLVSVSPDDVVFLPNSA